MAMAYAALIVNVEAGNPSEAGIRLAAGLTRRFGAALIGVAAEPLVLIPAADGSLAYSATLLPHEQKRVQAMLAAAERRFRSILPPEQAAEAEWRAFVEDPGDALAEEARSADLLVVGAEARADAGKVLMQAGRPILVVPAAVTALEASTIVIGWRDTTQARRAIADALPLLERAGKVLVLAVTGRNRPAAEMAPAGLEAIARLLVRHGVKAEAEARPLRQASVADELIHAARDAGADLIVSGGYGYARLREWAFGGVTRDLLTRCPICCLLSH
jgi:nucleotide-binding universal stress UspA family protein